jgi:hypothetical protein
VHAIIVCSEIDPERLSEAREGIPIVAERFRSRPGFVSATWLAPIDGIGMSASIWQSEEQANAVVPPIGFSPVPGVTVRSVEVREVFATA